MKMNKKRSEFFINDIPDNFHFQGSLAIDTEAMGLNVLRDRLCMIQICDSIGNIALIHFPNSNYNYECRNIKKYLENPNIEKIFHFARFDVAILKHYLKIKSISNIYCTKIASKFARTYTDKHSLKSVVGEFFDIDMKKEQRSTNWGSDVITESQKRYAENDVIYLHEIQSQLNVMLKQENRYDLVKKLSNFIDTLVESDLIGFVDDIFSHHSNPSKNS